MIGSLQIGKLGNDPTWLGTTAVDKKNGRVNFFFSIGSLLATKEVELAALRSEIESLARTNADLRQELLHEPLQRQLDNTVEVCKKLGQDLNRERILRKKYFNGQSNPSLFLEFFIDWSCVHRT